MSTDHSSFIAKIISRSFAKPVVALLLVLAGSVIGAVWLKDLRRDVFPDLSAPVFNVIVQNASMGAEELETAIKELPRDKEVVQLYQKLAGADPLPPR